MAVDDTSFRIEILSIASGEIVAKGLSRGSSEIGRGKPSMTYRGELPAVIENTKE